ncbi:single-stranded DNA-binding protein [Sphaerisporangium sp. B11E5]|uniref:single-stranded DNA-binding protein n=1 Tax=Sphaerisporangium sp. B11E5 TaxID=3153563 RepID=UPI00325D2194
MEDTFITVTGNVITDPRRYTMKDGATAALIRLAATPRYLDRRTQTWREAETAYYNVWCHRTLAEHALTCVHPGHPVVVHGRLRLRTFEKDGHRRQSAEIEATTIGHDLRRGTTTFTKSHLSTPATSEPPATQPPSATTSPPLAA